jgi:dTDP-4-amino-4,6-dideoxygalactose transaminase
MTRVYLSPPEVGPEERRMLLEAFDSNWIAPLGPDVDAFEAEFAERVGVAHGVALSSGTAALHLALLLVGVGPGDEVLVPSFTFVATANAVVYQGAVPVFVDCSPDTWTMDPDLVADELDRRAAAGRLPAAVVTVDLYGQSCDYDRLLARATGPGCRWWRTPPKGWAPPTGADRSGRSAGWACSRSTATRSSPPAAVGCW